MPITIFDKDYKKFLNKTTIICGPPQSGKTVIANEIQRLCIIENEISDVFLRRGVVSNEWLRNLVDSQQRRIAQARRDDDGENINTLVILDDFRYSNSNEVNSILLDGREFIPVDNDQILLDILCNQRFYRITLVIILQDHKEIPPFVKSRASLNIFTDYDSAISHIEDCNPSKPYKKIVIESEDPTHIKEFI